MNLPAMGFGYHDRQQDLRDSYEDPNALEDFDLDSVTEEEIAEVYELDAETRTDIERALKRNYIYEDSCTQDEWSRFMFAAYAEMNK